MAAWIAPLIAAGGSLLGGILNKLTTDQANRENIEAQREFAQNSIQWKVEDAKKAGIHPLAALGASGYTAAPSFVGSNIGDAVAGASKEFAQGLQNFYADQMQDQSESSKLDLENKRLENAKLAKEISQMGQSPFGGVAGGASVGIPNDPNLFNQSVKISKDMVLTKTGIPGEFLLGFDPESLPGQFASESLIGLGVSHLEMMRRAFDDRFVDQVNKSARSAGYLKKGEKFRYFWTPYGYVFTTNPPPKKR